MLSDLKMGKINKISHISDIYTHFFFPMENGWPNCRIFFKLPDFFSLDHWKNPKHLKEEGRKKDY